MSKRTDGIHHITAIVGDPQENVNFYAKVLGLRLVKKTVNFDDPGTYHFYFGDKYGNPGTIITFFPWEHAPQGVIGDGQVGITTYAVPKGALAFWEKRLTAFNIQTKRETRFQETFLQFADPHGLQIELVERETGEKNKWTFQDIHADVAIKGFGGAVLYSREPEQTAKVLQDVLGLEKIVEGEDYVRFQAVGDIGNVIDLKSTRFGRGQMGIGTVHHIAWRAKDDVDQLDWQTFVHHKGYQVTPVQDRNYFNAIYFREHGDLLFEIATDPPGFLHDEAEQSLGEKLMLPNQYERFREQLEKQLKPIVLPKNE